MTAYSALHSVCCGVFMRKSIELHRMPVAIDCLPCERRWLCPNIENRQIQ